LQHKRPDDFVIATGKQYTVKQFINFVCKELNFEIIWKGGSGINEYATDGKGNKIILCDKKYFRPTEVDALIGNPNKAYKFLKWKSKINIQELVKDMVDFELEHLNK
jgi:GDPmannose 4,6-dehydratase